LAERRTIACKISLSEQVAGLSDLAALCYTWGIIHANDWGAVSASPRVFKALVFPLRDDLTVAMVGAAIDEVVSARLAVRYEAGDCTYLWFPTFDKYQAGGLHKRTAPPHIMPGQDGSRILDNPELVSGNFPEVRGSSRVPEKRPEVPGHSRSREGKRSEEKRSEENETPSASDDAPAPKAPRKKREKKPEGALDLSDFANGQQELAAVILPLLDGWLDGARDWNNTARRNWVRDTHDAIRREEFSQEDLVRWLSEKDTRPTADRIKHPDWWWGKCRTAEERAKSGGPMRLPIDRPGPKAPAGIDDHPAGRM
jgi:hypothetical protein